MTAASNVVRLSGRFVFASHRSFNDAVDRALQSNEPVVVVDVTDVAYIDSAALGMLLLARHRAQVVGKTIALRGAADSVLQVLQIAKFDTLFALS